MSLCVLGYMHNNGTQNLWKDKIIGDLIRKPHWKETTLQRKENIKLIKGRDSLMREKIKMRKEIARLKQKLEKANKNRPNKNEKKVNFIENEIDDNGNAWENVSAIKSKNSFKTRTAVVSCAKATPTKGQKVIENKKQKKQTRQKSWKSSHE